MQGANDAIEFDRLVTPTPIGDGAFTIEVPDGWQQGRGAFGGLVLAMLARAAEATAADPAQDPPGRSAGPRSAGPPKGPARTLRSLSAQIVGPVQPGAAAIAVEVIRAGSAVTALSARLTQKEQIQAQAAVTLARSRDTYASPPSLPRPDMPPWRDGKLASLPVSVPLAPVFTQHLEFWPTGPLPFSGADPGAAQETAGWVRLRRPGRARDAAFVIALVDSYWPGFLVVAKAPRATATLTFSLETMSDLDGLDPDAPLFYRARILGGRDGYAVEARELWDESGRLVALNQQIFAVLT
jgi:acyl-CoA thioesterase